MSESSVRERIARAIYASDFDIPAEELEEEWAWSGAKQSYQSNADAVLAVLADLPDEVIEKAIRAVDSLDWSHLEFGEVPNSRETVISVLTAVFGVRQ